MSPRGSDTGESVPQVVVSDGVCRGYLLSHVSVLFVTLRLYSCLANGSADEFQRGDQLFRMRAVKDPLQIGKVPLCPVALPAPPVPVL